MADFDLPSFSLGLEFDLDSEPQPHFQPDPDPLIAQPQASSAAVQQHDDEDFESPPTGPGQDSSVIDPPRALKRLRRGPTLATQKSVVQEDCSNLDEDIEEFSSQEDNPRGGPATQCHSIASSSKFPLHRVGVLTSQSASKENSRNKKEIPTSSCSANMRTRSETMMFPKITGSPLRRFQLIASDSDSDSDFDDFSLGETVKNKSNQVNFQKKEKQSIPNNEDLWKDFSSEKSFHIPTPAFDEVCKEIFNSAKDKDQAQNNSKGYFQTFNTGKKSVQQCNLYSLPPAHRYFFNEDPRIQKLVRDRLPNFSPLDTTTNQGYQQHDASVIDYTRQFGHGEGSSQAAKRPKAVSNSTRGRKNAKKTNGKEISEESGNWVNPKSGTAVPKDAGKRRVQAVGKSAGHWFTGADGRKVYVTPNGKEMTGQLAYRHYRKESGAGFKTSKKKTTSKRKSGSKKK